MPTKQATQKTATQKAADAILFEEVLNIVCVFEICRQYYNDLDTYSKFIFKYRRFILLNPLLTRDSEGSAQT